MARIVEIHSAVLVVPLKQPVGWANATVSKREFILCWVVDEDGRTGVSYGMGSRYPLGAHLIHQAIQNNLKPAVLGKDPMMNEQIWEAMYGCTILIGRQGVVMRALSCIDIAIWDLKAKILGLPLYQLLGGHSPEVKAYASGGYYTKGGDASGLAKEIELYRSRGFDSFKIKVGLYDPIQEEERVAAAREAAGEAGKLAVDANSAWHSMAAAWPHLRRLEKYDLWWLEEPFAPDDRPAYRELAQRTNIPIAAGELECGRDVFRDYVDSRSLHILQPDASVVGGITEWKRVAAMAACWNLPVAPHWIPEIHAHLLAAVPNGWPVEYFLPESGILDFEQLIENPMQVKKGVIRLSDEPGHGIKFNRKKLEKFFDQGSLPTKI